MLTNRGRWLLLLAICGGTLGTLQNRELLVLVSLALLLWMLFEWILFRWRVEFVCRGLEVTRRFDGRRRVPTLWMGRPVTVQIKVKPTTPGGIPFLRVHDFLSVGLEAKDDGHIIQTNLRGPLKYEYQLIPTAAGRFNLPGVCARMCDLHGMFYAQRFLPCAHSVRVMPSCLPADSLPPLTKRHNALMPPGMHRFLRAGSGPELLELREYQPGDPPKSIAWKVSARKNTLMTRQYETEVPVRVTLFADGSVGARVGLPGHRALDSVVTLAATLAKAVMSDRDPVRLIQYGDSQTSMVKHGAGERHLFRILDALADMSFSHDRGPVSMSHKAIEQAWTVCEDLYPELLEPGLNRVPFTFFPIIPEERRWLKRRMRLATVFAELYQLPGDATMRLAYDDPVMARYLFQFLNQVGAPWTDAVYNAHGTNVVAGHGRLGTLASALTRAVAMAKDNEVFVLLSDLIDHAGQLGRLLDAVRVARSRHHRVVVICPWPAPIADEKLSDLPADIAEMTLRAEQERLQRASEQLRSEFRRLQVPFAMATDEKLVRLVLAEAGLAKGGRTSLVGAS